MAYIFYDETGFVNLIHYKPELLPDEVKQEGYEVEVIPEPEEAEGKVAHLHFSPTTKELWYEYEDIPLTEEELLMQRVADLEAVVDALLGVEA